MVDKMRALKGAGEIARTLGYLTSAAEKMKQGREGDASADLARGFVNVVKNWDLISYPFEILWKAWDTPSPEIVKSAMLASAEARRGFFTGKWNSQPGAVQLIYHDRYTNAVSLFFQKAGVSVFEPDAGRYNVYKGLLEVELEMLVLTGFNSQGQELVIIGNPDSEGHRIECDVWCRTGPNQIGFTDKFLLVRQRD